MRTPYSLVEAHQAKPGYQHRGERRRRQRKSDERQPRRQEARQRGDGAAGAVACEQVQCDRQLANQQRPQLPRFRRQQVRQDLLRQRCGVIRSLGPVDRLRPLPTRDLWHVSTCAHTTLRGKLLISCHYANAAMGLSVQARFTR